jgi:hypothetical protein
VLSRRSLLAAIAALPLGTRLAVGATVDGSGPVASAPSPAPARKTVVSVAGQAFYVNGKPTYAGRTWEGRNLEGLLLNSRMVQGTFDDENPETKPMWAYPDGSAFDAERNAREFVAAMPAWRAKGLLGFNLNLQGGSPQGYSKGQPWVNSAFDFATGALKPAYAGRLERILDAADALGMVPIVGLFYFGQASRFAGEQAVVAATDAATDWLLAKGYANVVVEITNECNNKAYPEVLRPARAHELIRRVQERSAGKVKSPAGRLLVSTSYNGGVVPGENVAAAADFLLLHGNGQTPDKVAAMVSRTRALAGYKGQPVLFNEDDHFDFDRPANNFLAVVGEGAGWGYFDYRLKGEASFDEGFQSVPVNWGISSARKRGFFDLLAKMTGANG